ncbi:4Fe-4S binding protein [Leptolyngbya ohadii]|uniref:4Fe-4S binding protein n=1 Tax=Leptolyngbya ohadii TaxID=1962290 RepID=UPI000B59BB75|nr:4Fe-4S binding protein [Leptolyngbya ohadii]
MTYTITSQCIQCHRCASICPTGAITQNETQYQINAERCNDCVGHYAVPQCWASCPTHNGCTSFTALSISASNRYWDSWFDTYNRLVSQLTQNSSETEQPIDYWQRWFNTYSQTISNLQNKLQTSTPVSVGVNA